MANKKDKKAAAAAKKKAEKEQRDNPATFETVCDEASVSEGDHKVVQMSNGRYVLLLRHHGILHALDAMCYHAGGPLPGADIEDLGGSACIVCPWHGHAIALATGKRLARDGSCQPPGAQGQRLHEVAVQDGSIMVRSSLTGTVNSDKYARQKPPGYQKEKANTTQPSPSDSGELYTARVTDARAVTHNSVVLTLESEAGKTIQHLCGGTGQHIDIQHPSGETRPYTPYWLPDASPHTAQLLVKSYPNGVASPWLAGLTQGELVSFKLGHSVAHHVTAGIQSVCMIAGGTGITPMLQLLFELTRQGALHGLRVSLIYANHRIEDIMLEDQINALAAEHEHMNVFYVLSESPGPSWVGGVGHITAEMLRQHLGPPSSDAVVLCCGPPGMHVAAKRILSELAYNMDCFHEFV